MVSRLFGALALAVCAVASTDSASAQRRPAAPDPLAGLDGYIQDAMAKLKGVGLAIAIVKDDSIVYAKGFGVKKLGDPAPVTPRTVFAVGSTTKAFTTAALGMLVDEGRFDWDTRATNLLPGFELYDPAVTREITVRDLVTHRSGLSRGDRLWMGGSFSRAEVIRRVRYHQPSWGIRTTFGYQNIMYLAAGEIVPAVTGRSWDEFLHDRIFRPLGMTSSSTTVEGLDKLPDVATPHTEIDGTLVPIEYRNIDNVGPAGSINSSVLDMAQWIRFHLNGGTVGGRALLSPETHGEMFMPQMLMRTGGANDLLYPGANFLAYGLGWFLFDHAGRKLVEHSGGIDGMVTELMMVPSEKVGVIALSNSGGSAVSFAVARAAVNRYLGVTEDPVAKIASMMAMLEGLSKQREDSLTKARAVGRGPSAALEAYTGVFDNPMYGPARVDLIDGKLVVAVDGQSEALDLSHWHYDTFRGASRDRRLGKTWVTFRLASDGAVSGLTIDGLEQEFTRRPAAALAAGCDPSDADRTRQASRLSPLDSTAVFVGGRAAKVCYSRPSVRGRQVFGAALVPFDSLWRTGANDPTTIYLPFPVTIGGLAVPAGKYSILTVPGRSRWELVLNRSLTQGTSNYATAGKPHELGRATAPVESLAEPVEQFTIRAETKGADSAELIFEWERTRVRFAVKGGAP